MSDYQLHTVAPAIHMVSGTNVNWIILSDGSDATLIDTGYLGDSTSVVASLADLGHKPEDVQAILITHSHLDHIGAAPWFAAEFDTPIYVDPKELEQAHGVHVEQATPETWQEELKRDSVREWLETTLQAIGGQMELSVPTAVGYPHPGALDLPGSPIPIDLPGHTFGHSAFFVPEEGVVITGDALVTGHPISELLGPQTLPVLFNKDIPLVARNLDNLRSLAADTVLPGHGDVYRGSLVEAIDLAQSRAGL